MRKFILFLATSTVFLTSPVVSTELKFELSNEEAYRLKQPIYSEYYDKIPKNPNVYHKTAVYSDENLSKPISDLQPNQAVDIAVLKVNDQMQPVFQLSNGAYILASQKTVFDDIPLEHSYDKVSFWTKPGFTVYTSPIGNEAKKVNSKLTGYSKVDTTETIKTARGQFAKTNEGWIDLTDLSSEDNRMEKVQTLLTDKYNKVDYSIYVQDLKTGLTAGINQNQMMYSASIAKLPILYYTQFQLDQGTIKLADTLKYTKVVNDFKGSYVTSGSGTISKTADDKNYSIDSLIKATAQHSDNVASNILSYYVAHQFDQDYYTAIDRIAGQRWDMKNRNSSAQMAGQVMAALYRQNPSGAVLSALSSTDYDSQRIPKNIDVKIAHKIGDAYDYKHDVALVYTDSPFVISIFTNHSSYDSISDIAADVYGILK